MEVEDYVKIFSDRFKQNFTKNAEEEFEDLMEELCDSLEEGETPSRELRDLPKLHEKCMKMADEIWSDEIPKRPPKNENDVDRLMDYVYYLFYYSVQYVILYEKYGGEIPKLDPYADRNRVDIREKLYFIHLSQCYKEFSDCMAEIAKYAIAKVENGLRTKIGTEHHVLFWFFQQAMKHEELHSRRLKMDPNISRTKSDSSKATINAVTNEVYTIKNPDHKNWRMLIVYPLPSDYENTVANDPVMGAANWMNLQIDKQNGTSIVPDPFGIVVTPEWDRLIRFVHILVYFEEYLYSYIANGISQDVWDKLKPLDWNKTWKIVMGEYSEIRASEKPEESPIVATVKGLKKQKKVVTATTYRTVALRNLINTAIKFKFFT